MPFVLVKLHGRTILHRRRLSDNASELSDCNYWQMTSSLQKQTRQFTMNFLA